MATFHVRSNSLPSKQHPFTSQLDEQLNRLKSSESTSSSLSSSSIVNNLNGLQDLYDCVDKLHQLSLTQQALSQEQHKKWIHELLDGSLLLLDFCCTAKDSLLQMKDSTLELQSVLRRRRGGKLGTDEIKKYLSSRTFVRKTIHKAMKNLEVKESCIGDKDHEIKVEIYKLKEVEAMTFTVLKSLSSFISVLKTQSKPSGLSLVSKFMRSKRIACANDEENDVNEFEKVDAELISFIGCKKSKSDQIFNVQNHLKNLEMCIQDLEEGIECLSRCLIKSRVSLLNIMNN